MAEKKGQSVSIFLSDYSTLRLMPKEFRIEALDAYLEHAFGFKVVDVESLTPESNPSLGMALAAGMIRQYEYWKGRSETNSANRAAGYESARKATNPNESAPIAAAPAVTPSAASSEEKEAIILETAYRFLERGVKGAYDAAEAAYNTNEATGWMKGNTPIKDKIAWLQGYKVETTMSMEFGTIFAKVCRATSIKTRSVINGFTGCFYEDEAIQFNFASKPAMAAFVKEFKLSEQEYNRDKIGLVEQIILKECGKSKLKYGVPSNR